MLLITASESRGWVQRLAAVEWLGGRTLNVSLPVRYLTHVLDQPFAARLRYLALLLATLPNRHTITRRRNAREHLPERASPADCVQDAAK